MIAPNDGVLESFSPAIAERDVAGTYPYRLTTVVAPPSSLGNFTYAVEVDHGHGWHSASPLRAHPVRIKSGERKEIPIYALPGPVRCRLRTLSWEAVPEQMLGRHPSVLQPLLESGVPGVRDGAQLALRYL